VASNQYGLNFHFDEREINIIFEKTNHRIYYDVPFAEVKIRKFSFELLHRDENEIHKNKDHFFIWKNGSLYRLYYDRIYKKVMAEEYAYFHFLKRKMKLLNGIEGAKQLLIVPNEIKPLNHLVPDMILKKYSLNKIYISYYVERLNPDFIFNKIINVAKSYFFNLSSRVNANPHFSYKFNSHHVRISEIQKIQ
jgi:hypothetical protein